MHLDLLCSGVLVSLHNVHVVWTRRLFDGRGGGQVPGVISITIWFLVFHFFEVCKSGRAEGSIILQGYNRLYLVFSSSHFRVVQKWTGKYHTSRI